MFKKNVSNTDRIVRLIFALVFSLLAMYWASGTMAVVLYVLALLMLVTSAIGYCGLYSVFGISTCKISKKEDKQNS